jgi:hypothetical protein
MTGSPSQPFPYALVLLTATFFLLAVYSWTTDTAWASQWLVRTGLVIATGFLGLVTLEQISKSKG